MKTNKHIVVLRGIPASGKTTFASKEVNETYFGVAVRINNDELSNMLFAGANSFAIGEGVGELLHGLRLSMLETALKQNWIERIYIDNTNLSTRTIRSFYDLATKYGATFEVDDRFLDADVDECIARDAQRDKPVGEAVIRKMAREAERLKPWLPPYVAPNVTPYINDIDRDEKCVIVDIDGTLAHMTGRNPYDYHRVIEDAVDPAVLEVVKLLDADNRIVIMSGRDDDSMDVTVEWLKLHGVPYDEIHMRRTGDNRPDWIVKHELFQEFVADKYDVLLVLDDRNQVIDLWRNKLALPTWQVAEGDF